MGCYRQCGRWKKHTKKVLYQRMCSEEIMIPKMILKKNLFLQNTTNTWAIQITMCCFEKSYDYRSESFRELLKTHVCSTGCLLQLLLFRLPQKSAPFHCPRADKLQEGAALGGTKLVLLPLVVRAPFRAARRSGSCYSHKIIKSNARKVRTACTHGAGEKAAKWKPSLLAAAITHAVPTQQLIPRLAKIKEWT